MSDKLRKEGRRVRGREVGGVLWRMIVVEGGGVNIREPPEPTTQQHKNS